jgi:hypothetical protein
MSARKEANSTRQRLAYEAARLMADGGVVEMSVARRKAAERLRVSNKRFWPDNGEVQQALLQQQRLFQPLQQDNLQQLRQCAVQAMRAFARFRPRLIGPVLDGTADQSSPVNLYLFAETPDEVAHALLEQRIPWQEKQQKLNYRNGESRRCPSFHFLAGDAEVELLVLPVIDRREPPLNPLTQQADRGARIEQVMALLDAPPEAVD